MDLVTYNPLAGGLFSGKITSKDLIPKEGRYSDADKDEGKMYRERYFKDSNFEALKLIEPVAQKHNLTMLEIALRWIRHHSQLRMAGSPRPDPKANDGVIIGVSSFDQLKGNLDHLEKGPLPEEVVQTLDKAWLITKGTAPNYWHLDLEYTYNTVESLFGKKG